MFVCQPRASKIAPSGPMSLTRPISLTRGCEICLSPDSSVNESLNEHCTCLSVDVLCEWYAVRMRRPGKSIRPSIFSVGAAMRSNATGEGRATRRRTAVGGSTCRGNETMSRAAVVVQLSDRPPVHPSPLRSASNCTSDRQSNSAYDVVFSKI